MRGNRRARRDPFEDRPLHLHLPLRLIEPERPFPRRVACGASLGLIGGVEAIWPSMSECAHELGVRLQLITCKRCLRTEHYRELLAQYEAAMQALAAAEAGAIGGSPDG